MRRTAVRFDRYVKSATPPLIRIKDATFYRHHPAAEHDAKANPPLFPGLNFELPSNSVVNQHWAVLSPSSTARTALLQVLRGQHVVVPADARSYPYLSTPEIAEKDSRLRDPFHAIQYVGFDAERGGLGGAATKGAYLSARYESHREATDFSLLDYLRGNTELNASEELRDRVSESLLERVIKDLNLGNLTDLPVSNLSNGQTRRARIAKALLKEPELLLLDGPFQGLDPMTLENLSALLHRLSKARAPRLILSLRPQDEIPAWITHFAVMAGSPRISAMGTKVDIFRFLKASFLDISHNEIETAKAYCKLAKDNRPTARPTALDASEDGIEDAITLREMTRHLHERGEFDMIGLAHTKAASYRETLFKQRKVNDKGTEVQSRLYREKAVAKGAPYKSFPLKDGLPGQGWEGPPPGEKVVEMEGVKVQYGNRVVLGDWKTEDGEGVREGLYWDVRRGQRWGVFGPNGSGKTTLLSLMTSDHPQTYSQPIKLFGRSRLPAPGEPGISIFDLQSRIGHSSPEVHTFFPKHLSVRRVLESAFADTPLTRPRLNETLDNRIGAALRWFRAELAPSLGPTVDQKLEALRKTNELRGPSLEKSWYMHVIENHLAAEEMDQSAIDWADSLTFGEMSFNGQRVALFLRAIIHEPDLLILDEAFSGMDESARDKCLLFLNHGENMTFRYMDQYYHLATRPRPYQSDLNRLQRARIGGLQDHQALIVVSHSRDEVPGSVRDFLRLPEAGSGMPARIGRLDGPLDTNVARWANIWGTDAAKRQRASRFQQRAWTNVWKKGPQKPAFDKSGQEVKDWVNPWKRASKPAVKPAGSKSPPDEPVSKPDEQVSKPDEQAKDE